MKLLVLIVVIAEIISVFAEKARFDNYRIYSIRVYNEDQLKVLTTMEQIQNGIIFIKPPVSVHRLVEVLVPPHLFADVIETFDMYEMDHSIRVQNLQQLIDEEQPNISTLKTQSFGWEKYYDLDAIYSWLDNLVAENPHKLTNYEYGRSYENRTLRAIKVSSDKSENKPTIFIEANIHAREWVTAATATYILNELVTSDDEDIKELVDKYDWVFVPVVNVDGYQYTHTTNRIWRKTRKPYFLEKRICYGADPNRNFNFHHADEGASTHPCSEIFAGPKPFSEPEARYLSEFIETFDNLKLYMSFHSYSQLLMFPYGHTKDHAFNHEDMLQIGERTIDAISERYGTEYNTGSVAEAIYLASGSSIDWVYGTQNVNLTYTFEFRDKGRWGFILPADQIIPNSLEVLDGLKAMVQEANDLNYL